MSTTFQQLIDQGDSARHNGHAATAIKAYRAAINQAMEAGDDAGLAKAQRLLGVTYRAAGDLDHAIAELENTAEYYRHIIDHGGRGRVSRDIGACYADRHDYSAAVQWLLRSVHELQQTNDRAELGLSETRLGLLYLSTSEAKRAEGWIVHGLATIREAGNWFYEVTALMHYGQLCLRTNRPHDAATAVWAGVGLTIEYESFESHRRRLAQLYGLLGHVYQRLGDQDTARRFRDRAAKLLAHVPEEAAALVRDAYSEAAVAPLPADLLAPAVDLTPPSDPNLADGPSLG